eukprot:gene11721-35010_t
MTDSVELRPEQLRALLDDAQATLAASLGRMEAHRIQNKQLLDEVSQLRNVVHGAEVDKAVTKEGVQRIAQTSLSGLSCKELFGTAVPTKAVLVSGQEDGAPVEIVNGGKK